MHLNYLIELHKNLGKEIKNGANNNFMLTLSDLELCRLNVGMPNL